MRLLLHAVATTEPAALSPIGLRDQPLIVVRHAEMSAYASRFEAPVEHFGRADLLAHHAIVSGLSAQIDVLPARFPTWLADEDALRAELERRQMDFGAALDRVRGRVEIAMTVMWTTLPESETPPEAATPGLKYMLGRQQAVTGSDRRRARSRQLAEELELLVGLDLVEIRHQVCPSTTVALSSAVLVPRASAEDVKKRITRAEQDVRILINGPWPPYTFADVV
jgi:hypothetical protein